MTDGIVYEAGWTLDDVDWSRFDSSKVNAALLAAVKAASLVEYNAPDYVTYLKRVYSGAPESTIRGIEHWGDEEIQHGLGAGALGRNGRSRVSTSQAPSPVSARFIARPISKAARARCAGPGAAR